MTVKVVTDSASDLPPDLAQELGITIVPAYVGFGGKTYKDGVDISPDEVYRKMVEENLPATTSQPPPLDFANIYRELLKDADGIVSIQATSKLSGLYNSAMQGKAMVKDNNRIEVVDSLSASMGLGLVVVFAARLAAAGENLSKIAEEARQCVFNIRLSGMFDTFKYLLQGGRLSKAKAIIGSIIPVKPLLAMRDGELHPTGAVRTRIKGLDRLVDNFKKAANVQEMAIVHSTTPEDAQTLKDRLGTMMDKNTIHISRLGAALGVHGGPGTIVLALREKASTLGQPVAEAEAPKKRISLPSLHRPRLRFSQL